MPDKLRAFQIEACRVAAGRRPSGSPAGWAVLNDAEWNQLLRFLDENGLTLLFRRRADPSGLPVWVQQRLAGDYRNNCERYEAISAQQSLLVDRMAERGIEVAVLKGIPLATQLYPDPCDRVQYDLDFYVEPEQLLLAVEACIELGYQVEPDQTSDHVSLTPASASEYLWDGDFFRPNIPLKIELHDRLWDSRYHIDLAGVFASPVMVRSAVAPATAVSLGLKSSQAGRACSTACVLATSNHFLFIQLHFFRHLFQNQVRLSHLYEAVTLDPADASDALRQSGILRQIFFVNCSLAARLFGPELPSHEPPSHERKRVGNPRQCFDFDALAAAHDENRGLPAWVQRWLNGDSLDDLLSRFRGNKNFVRLQMEFSPHRWRVLKSALAVHRLPRLQRVRYHMAQSRARRVPIQYLAYTVEKAWEHLHGYARLLLGR
ncbi:MAG: nucleotidyltransferase family protein [Acidobacteriota bacterium]